MSLPKNWAGNNDVTGWTSFHLVKRMVRFGQGFACRQIWYNAGMKLYQTIDGTMIGFYRERGGEVQALLYRDVYESQLVLKTRQEQITIPGYYKIDVTTIAGYWHEEQVFIPGHYERQMVWHPEYSVTRYREVPGHYEHQMVWHPEYSVTRYRDVPGHYEIQNIWVPEYYVTRYYWREAHPARGLEAAWIPYQHLIPAGYKDQRVWVDTYTEEYQEIMPAGEKDTRVWVDTYMEEYQELMPAGEKETRVWVVGKYLTEKYWVPETKETTKIWIPSSEDFVMIELWVLEEVWVGREPVYQYVDESQVRLFEVLELFEGAAPGPDFEDVITIRNMLNGEELRTTARYLGLATRLADNEFVVP